MGLRVGLDVFEDKIFVPAGVQTPDCPACSVVTVVTQLSRLPRFLPILSNSLSTPSFDTGCPALLTASLNELPIAKNPLVGISQSHGLSLR